MECKFHLWRARARASSRRARELSRVLRLVFWRQLAASGPQFSSSAASFLRRLNLTAQEPHCNQHTNMHQDTSKKVGSAFPPPRGLWPTPPQRGRNILAAALWKIVRGARHCAHEDRSAARECVCVKRVEQREMAQWSSDESDGECDSDEDESCAWLYE